MEGVIIDVDVPLAPYERCLTLFEYLIKISEEEPHSHLDPARFVDSLSGLSIDDRTTVWEHLEIEIVRKIQDTLPDDREIVVAGDVNVRLKDDPCDCGTVFGENHLYLIHTVGHHPDCTGVKATA